MRQSQKYEEKQLPLRKEASVLLNDLEKVFQFVFPSVNGLY